MSADRRTEATPASSRPRKAIEINNVWEEFRLFHNDQTKFTDFLINRRGESSTFWALKDVSFNIHQGDIFGLIGENGSGKSTLLKCIAGILPPSKGSINSHGTISPLLELGAGFHPDLTGRENIYLNASILGLTKKQIAEVEEAIIGFSELEEFIDSPLKNYSSGMKVRLGFAIAINVNPDILLIDEVLAVGDADFSAKCQERLSEYREQKKTILLVSHTLASIEKLCNRAAWLSKGELQVVGETQEVIDTYLNFVREKRGAKTGRDRARGKETAAAGRTPSPARSLMAEVTIEKVSLRNAAGAEEAVFVSGDELRVRLAYSSTAQFNPTKLVFEVAFYSSDAALIAIEHGEVAGEDSRSGTIAFRLDRNPFTRGIYRISVGVRGENPDSYHDYHDRQYKLKITDPANKDKGGAVNLDGSWIRSSVEPRVLEIEGSETT